LAKALDIAEAFAGDVEFLQLNKDLSEQGRDNQRRAKLRAAIRDLRDARTPVDEMQKKLDAKRKAVAMPAFDPKDSTGFLRRQELRSVLRSMNAEQRAMHLNDPSFADALLEQPAIVSGLFLAEDFKGTISPEIATLSPRQKKNGSQACSVRSSRRSPNSKRSRACHTSRFRCRLGSRCQPVGTFSKPRSSCSL